MPTIDDDITKVIHIRAPEWFARDDFMDVINGFLKPESKGCIATWHKGGPATEYSDIFTVLVDGESDHLFFPADIMQEFDTLVADAPNEAIVWISPC